MTPRRPFRKRVFRIPTADSLAQAALSYLSRYAASEASLRRVLENRLRRAAMQNEAFAADRAAQTALKTVIETLIAKHTATGVLNDEAFAAMKVRSLRRAGGSARIIAQKLEQKGLARPLIHTVLHDEDEGLPEEQEERAALAFAKRRRLGPFRSPSCEHSPDEARVLAQKDIKTLLRAGFSFDMVKRVLQSTPE